MASPTKEERNAVLEDLRKEYASEGNSFIDRCGEAEPGDDLFLKLKMLNIINESGGFSLMAFFALITR